MKNNKKGFTIVELVIVIAVIAILAAVLIPTFTIVVKKAKDSNALSAARDAVTKVTAEITTVDSIKDGTIFAVADKKNDVAKHFIAYDSTKEENLAQVSTEENYDISGLLVDAEAPADDYYVVFAKTVDAAEKILDNLMGDIDINKYYNGTTAVDAADQATNYVAGTYYTAETAVSGKNVHLFLCEDMPEVAVAILK